MAASRKPRTPEQLASAVAAGVAARLTAAGPVCVALSGGCDSLVLLHLLKDCLAGRLTAIHVHHGLSPQADAWAAFCEQRCAAWRIPLDVHRVAVDRASPEGLESAARRARYAAFARVDAEVLLLAQHRDDQAETLLFNLLRGSGIAGLAAMPVERTLAGKRLLRPLLDVSRAELEAYACAHDLDWVEDESNDDQRFSRNFLRHAVLPVLRGRFPAVDRHLAQAAAHCAEADALLAEFAAEDWQRLSEEGQLALSGLRSLSPARARNLLRYRLRQLGWRAPAAGRLAEFVRQLSVAGPDRHPSLDLPDGRMRVQGGRLCWEAGGPMPPR